MCTHSPPFYNTTLRKSRILKKVVGVINLFGKCVNITKLFVLYELISRGQIIGNFNKRIVGKLVINAFRNL